MDPTDLKDLGPWAVAFLLAMFTFKDIILALVRGRNGNGHHTQITTTAQTDVLRSLERIEAAFARQEQVLVHMLDLISQRADQNTRLLERLDVRIEDLSHNTRNPEENRHCPE